MKKYLLKILQIPLNFSTKKPLSFVVIAERVNFSYVLFDLIVNDYEIVEVLNHWTLN